MAASLGFSGGAEPGGEDDRLGRADVGRGAEGPADPGGAPPLLLFLTELQRALTEVALHVAAQPILRAAPSGDGHPVLVLPGFYGDDLSTLLLRRFLRSRGYWTHGWRLGRNIGPTPEVVEGLGRRLDEVVQRHGRAASVIGWSLGGIYARELARRSPDAVRTVITLGAPFRLSHPNQTRAYRRFQRYSHLHVAKGALPPPEATRPPLPVPSTAVYSRLDGIVAWQACVDVPGPIWENVAVHGSHLGLGHNPSVLWVIADRLAQPEGEWHPFRAPSHVRHLYPAPGQASDPPAAEWAA